MKPAAITDAKLKAMKPPATGRFELSDTIVPGLRVRMSASGIQSFIVRKRIAGKPSNITLGRYGPRFGLAEARKKARAVLSDIEAGGDPSSPHAALKRAQPGAETIRGLLPAYLAAKAERRSVREMKRVMENYVLPELGDRLADAVTRADVTRLIDKIAANAPVMARNVHAQLSAFYSWAMPRLDRLPSNPCRDAGRPSAPKARDRVLSDRELVCLWQLADAEPFPWNIALKLLILTGQRRSEVFEANRAEIDFNMRVWTIPEARAKNGKKHEVPLTTSSLELLEKIPEHENSGKLFPAQGRPDNGASGFSKIQARLRKSMTDELGSVAEWRLHDVRRTVATGLQRLGVRLEVTEAVLNHLSGTRAGIVGVYQRYSFADEKRVALETWSAEIGRLVSSKIAHVQAEA